MHNHDSFDVIIVGASFAGLTAAHHLPASLRVLVVDAKPSAGASVESTGLITTRTRDEFLTFFDVDRFLTNPIRSICVVAPDLETSFVSSVKDPWIFQTDTKALVAALAESLPSNVTYLPATVFLGVDDLKNPTSARIQTKGEEGRTVAFRILMGADGGHSRVAASVNGLDQNTNFLFGYEQVFFGEVHFGEHPWEMITHVWFGEFSLGYGGWISPTLVDGKRAFRIGLAKLSKERGEAKRLLQLFLEELVRRGKVSVEGTIDVPGYVFGSHIPIGGVRRHIATENIVLLGDAAGYCGAFAADGIKGAVVSGKEGAALAVRALEGETGALKRLHRCVDAHDGLLRYYTRQRLYRFIWDRMRSNRSFWAMFNIVAAERETFLHQFCDSKDKHKSLAWTVLKVRYAGKLVRYGLSLIRDLFR